MNTILENDILRVSISSRGAEMQSIYRKDKKREYLWQGDSEIWDEQAPNLFPYIGRLTDGKYTYDGKEYQMKIHGCMKYMDLQEESNKKNKVVFQLEDNDQTREQYPFSFVCEVEYELMDNTVRINYRIENKDEKIMYFGMGGHPGFQVPMEENKRFEDYYLEFENGISPKEIVFSEDCFVTGDRPYEMKGGRYIKLCHQLFDDDAIVLKNAGDSVKLLSEGGKNAVTVKYPQMNYLGIWQKPRTKAAYICLEPWTSLPSRKGVIEDISKQKNLITLAPGEMYGNRWEITID